jgi:phage regulator Rha-like protein
MLITWTDDIKDTVIEAFDEMGEAYDESANKLDHYNKILTTYENIIGLVGKDTLGISDSVFGELTQAQVDNAVNLLRVHKEAYETDKAAL